MKAVFAKKIKISALLLLMMLLLTACGSKQSAPVIQKEITIPPGNILFFSKTCAHCAIVEQYISDNNVHQKLYFVEREITTDQDAYNLFPVIGQRCGINTDNLGVPLFWDGIKCYLGDENIINYFKNLP